ncbi:MAG: mobile mystery protein A [Alphaproteobacteria bacterium]|nr:mobile mystery protein A [Alphaproteobacteria bacterium]
MKRDRTTLARHQLDERFAALPLAERLAAPARGWIKAIREALGMSSAQLARRLGVKQPTLAAIERSEARGTIELATLRRVAAALDCTLAYALMPNRPLATTVKERARTVAGRRLQAVEHSMLLENQALPAAERDARIDSYASEIDPRRLWDDA